MLGSIDLIESVPSQAYVTYPLGRFVEIEIVTEAAMTELAQTALLQLAKEWGLPPSEPRSYLEMVLARSGAAT